ncbi:endolytic transglycosylase MltG [Plebeiibacterium sediminum]|uniref:Endolytic murein transglycosylase n=1 Tax=Plebeiibacterium sediminum TaxID=2992112 RepID=A0AAE3M7M5_9BACT|nr:endolytic transglycosylase MltG [Plebeiobacterium sediminum]MCW3788315.1 endolytic transglycosylase MltG [Plebeiobacterium sediminum]
MTKTLRRMWLFIVVLVLLAVLLGGRFYRYIYGNNVDLTKVESPYLYVPNGTTFSGLKKIIEDKGALKDIESFVWVAQKKGYNDNIKGGRYLLKQGMNNNQLINLLRSGRQEAINITFNNIRKPGQLASVVSAKLMADSAELVSLFSNDSLIRELGFTRETFLAMFIPNTYQMYWNTDAKAFVIRMKKEYDRFWSEDKRNKAKALGLSPVEVSILASIVDEETIMSDEKPVVAGLYINRLNKKIRLQADPTVKYALGDFTIQRVLSKDLEIDSPYNTYMYAGLPPGPIRIPSIVGINAVLNRKEHSYYYMCAKEDFSGYHNFAKTLAQHNINAARYRNELRKRGIRR